MWQQRRLARSATAELGWTYTPGGTTVRALRIAASLLRSVGHPDVTDLVGAYAAWEQQTVDA